MQIKRISISIITTLLATVFMPSAFKLSAPLFIPQVLAQTSNTRKAEADRLLNQGREQYKNSQVKAALESSQQALKIYREIGDRRGEGNSLGNLGRTYIYMGEYNNALDVYQQSLVIGREIGDRRGEGGSLGNLGNVYYFLGEYEKAVEFHQQSLSIAREIGDRRGEGGSLGNLGLVYESLAEYKKAIDLYQQSLAIAQEISDHSMEGTSLMNLANAYNSLGEYKKAIDLYQQSLAIAQEISDRRGESNSLINLANAYDSLGEYKKAIDLYQQSLAIAKEISDRRVEGASLGNIGNAYNSLGEYKKAIEFHQQSLAIAREIGNRSGEGASLGNIGSAYNSLGEYKKVIEFHQQSLAIARKIGNRSGEGASLGNIGNAYDSLGEYKKAIEFHQQSLAIARKIGNRSGEGASLNNLGLVLYKSGDLSAAEKTLFEGIKVWESLREFSGNDANKVSIFEEQARTYRILQQVLIAQNKTDTALEIAERGRARAFVELLTKRLSPNPKAANTITPPNIEQIKQIAKTQNSTLVQYSIIYDEFKLNSKEENKESKLYIWVIKPNTEVVFHEVDLKPLWQKQNTSLAELVPSVRDAINVRGGNTNKITYTPGQYVKFQDDLKHWQPWEIISVNPQKRTLTVRQATYQPGLEDERSFDEVQQIDQSSLQQLYQILIQPIADLLPKTDKDRVIFIPQQELFLVPFPALQDPQGKYLIEKHTILTAPSIQVLDLTRQQQQRLSNSANLPNNILVVGNPIPNKIGALPYAEEEAKAIAQTLNTKAITTNQATKTAIVSQMPQARIIHIAAHGILDDLRGLGSAIALAAKNPDEGLLTAEEILNLKLNAELVVLSACDTGRGRITGDGIIGLSRSLISAGVPSVIVSLWKVPDNTTSGLMTEFYHQLRQHPDKAQALRQAMLTTMKKHPQPKDWAAFTLIGEAE